MSNTLLVVAFILAFAGLLGFFTGYGESTRAVTYTPDADGELAEGADPAPLLQLGAPPELPADPRDGSVWLCRRPGETREVRIELGPPGEADETLLGSVPVYTDEL